MVGRTRRDKETCALREMPAGRMFCSACFVQQGLGDLFIKILDQRAHEECGNDGADSGDGGDLPETAACQKENRAAQNHAGQVSTNAAVLEFGQFPFAGEDNGDSVVGGDTQIGRHVQGRTETKHHNPNSKEYNPQEQGRGGEYRLQKLQGELGDIAQQEQIDKGGDSDIPPVKHQRKNQQHRIDQHIQGAEWDGNQGIETAHQRLERVHTQCGQFKDTDTDGADQHTCQRHEDSSCFHRSTSLECAFILQRETAACKPLKKEGASFDAPSGGLGGISCQRCF